MMTEPLRILIVDDNYLMTKTLRDIFRVKGYQVEVAHSGLEALEKIEQAPFDCILSDIEMADLNGVELCRAIKARYFDMPVVLMTAFATKKLIEEGFAEGVVSVLTKPLDIGLLFNCLACLDQKNPLSLLNEDDDDPA